jgi:phage baseplate assembly protein W
VGCKRSTTRIVFDLQAYAGMDTSSTTGSGVAAAVSAAVRGEEARMALKNVRAHLQRAPGALSVQVDAR